MIGDEISTGSSSGMSALLFGPIFLAAEFLGNVLPGLLFYLLLILKRNPLAYLLLQTPLIGYRTKLLLVLFLSFIVGKLLGTPYAMLQAGVFPGNSPIQVERTKRSKEQDILLHAALGAILMPNLTKKSGPIDFLALGNATVYFHFSSGLALLIGSAIPGDGHTLRTIELAVGVLFLVSGYFSAKHFIAALMAFAGMSLKEFIEKIPPAYLPALLPILTQFLETRPNQPKPE